MSSDVRPTGRVSASSSTTSLTAQLDDQSTITRRRRAASTVRDEDPWGSVEDLTSPILTATHPLSSQRRTSSISLAPDATASRPNLARLTTEVEREVAAANAASRSSIDDNSIRGSLDLLRGSLSPTPKGDVEVLVHEVKPGESIAGVALQYGIDLATLRKVNKLWPTDPITLRRTLYIPLEACRWAKSTQSVVRGPLENQITLVQKSAEGTGGSRKGKEREEVGNGYLYNGQRKASISRGGAADRFLPSTNLAYNGIHDSHPSSSLAGLIPGPRNPTLDVDPPTPDRVLDIIRIPSSELAFFPKSKLPLGRKSLDAYTASTAERDRPGLPRSNSSSSAGPLSSYTSGVMGTHMGSGKIRRSFAPPSMTPSAKPSLPDLQAHRRNPRPPSTNPSTSTTNPLTSRLTSLFISPPAYLDPPSRQSFDSSSGTSTPAIPQDPAFELVNRVSTDARQMDWFASGDDPGKGRGTENGHRRTLTTTQPTVKRGMVVPGGKGEVGPVDLTAPWD